MENHQLDEKEKLVVEAIGDQQAIEITLAVTPGVLDLFTAKVILAENTGKSDYNDVLWALVGHLAHNYFDYLAKCHSRDEARGVLKEAYDAEGTLPGFISIRSVALGKTVSEYQREDYDEIRG